LTVPYFRMRNSPEPDTTFVDKSKTPLESTITLPLNILRVSTATLLFKTIE